MPCLFSQVCYLTSDILQAAWWACRGQFSACCSLSWPYPRTSYFLLLLPSSETQRHFLTLQVILDLWSARGPDRGRALFFGSLLYLKSPLPGLEWGVIFDTVSDVSHEYSWSISKFSKYSCVFSLFWLIFSNFFLCLYHSAFHQVGHGKHVLELPVQILFPDSVSGCPQSTAAHCSEQKGALAGCCSAMQCHCCPYSCMAECCIRWVTHQFRAWACNSFCFQLQWCNLYLSVFLKVVCFSLSETI